MAYALALDNWLHWTFFTLFVKIYCLPSLVEFVAWWSTFYLIAFNNINCWKMAQINKVLLLNTLTLYCWLYSQIWQSHSHQYSNLFTRFRGQYRFSPAWITTPTRRNHNYNNGINNLNWFLFRTITLFSLRKILISKHDQISDVTLEEDLSEDQKV